MENSSSIIYYRTAEGEYLPIANKHGYLNVINTPFQLSVSRGILDGYSVFAKSGYNGAVTGGEEDIWTVGGVFVQPTAEMQMEVVSSSASDTTGGTGAQAIRIFYLNNLFIEKSTDVIMNGITPVATTATDIYRINGVKVITMGSNGAAVGDIDVRHLANTPIYSQISADHARDRCFIYTVPAGKALFVTSVLVGCGAQTSGRHVEFTPKATFDAQIGMLNYFQDYPEILLQDSALTVNFEFPARFLQGTELKMGAFSPDGSTACSVTARGWLETV